MQSNSNLKVLSDLTHNKCYRDRFLEGRKRYRCLTGKCYPKSEVMKLKSISREEQLERLRNWYRQRGSEGKARLLDEFCEQYGYHRKHAIRLLNGSSAVAKKSPPGPEPQYDCISQLVERIWTAGVRGAHSHIARTGSVNWIVYRD